MSKKPRKVPSYCRHKHSGRAVVRIDEEDHYLGPYGSEESHEKYAQLISEWQQRQGLPAHHRSTPSRGPGLSVNELIHAYWLHAEAYYVKDGKPTDHQYGIKAALRVLRSLYGRTPAHNFGPLALKAVRGAMIEKELSRNYINSNVDRIRRMFKWAVSEELLPVAVYQALRTVPGLKKGRCPGVKDPERVKPVSEEHIGPALEHCSPQIGAMVQVQRLAGMRPDEVTIMRPMDIDRNGEVWIYTPEIHKTEHHDIARVIPLGPRAQEILQPWLDREPSSYLFSPREAVEALNSERRKARKTPMTPSQSARKRKKNPRKAPRDHYDDESYCQAVQRACQKAAVPIWSPGRLRHNAGTEIRKRYGLEAAKVVLGHQSISTTQVYAEKNMAQAIEIMREMG